MNGFDDYGGGLAAALAALMQAHERQQTAPQGRLSQDLLTTLDGDGPARGGAGRVSGQQGQGRSGWETLGNSLVTAANAYMNGQNQSQMGWGKAGYGAYQAENTGGGGMFGGLFGGASGGMKSPTG